jgi:hypothetical protein
MLTLIMRVAMTLLPFYAFMAWTGTTLVLLTLKISKLEVSTAVGN